MQELQETQVWSLGREDPLEMDKQPMPLFLPGNFHGQSSLAGYSPWGCKELDMTETIKHTQDTWSTSSQELWELLYTKSLCPPNSYVKC